MIDVQITDRGGPINRPPPRDPAAGPAPDLRPRATLARVSHASRQSVLATAVAMIEHRQLWLACSDALPEFGLRFQLLTKGETKWLLIAAGLLGRVSSAHDRTEAGPVALRARCWPSA